MILIKSRCHIGVLCLAANKPRFLCKTPKIILQQNLILTLFVKSHKIKVFKEHVQFIFLEVIFYEDITEDKSAFSRLIFVERLTADSTINLTHVFSQNNVLIAALFLFLCVLVICATICIVFFLITRAYERTHSRCDKNGKENWITAVVCALINNRKQQ